ncbi:hypothetical protein [Brevundimonas goettingensis]|jgi:hypothetical protein|uniref:Uncharacterized protein n=1 Tax=Brevundimonas goettingensis TaxID=2774190 RepID=A0A975BZW1_9CAUL|nr:hypothetical protein [Brevundimonas goettingensis]QTC90212.1 hypothetical protein IFJ75_13085 [Brevundimonas goettingensis]
MMADNRKTTERTSRAKFVALVVLTGVGAAMLGGGIAWGLDKTGDAATAAGVIAGMGAAFMAAGGICAWVYRPNGPRWRVDPAEPGRRDRLQAQRARQLAIFPALSLLFLAQAFGALEHVVEGQHRWVDYVRLAVPVLYAWVTALMVMGWDGGSMKNRRFLEDELTQSLRARAMTLAFFVLMAGTTLSLGLGLWRAEIGVASLILALAAAGAVAGLRFAWLFREAGRDE